MFKVVIFDLLGVFSEHKNIYTILKKITHYKGTVKSMKAYMAKTYEKLMIGEITELTFWKKLKKVTNSRRKPDTLKKSFLKAFKPVFKSLTFKKVRSNFKVALCSDFLNSWWLYLKTKYMINFDYEVLSSSLKINKPEPELYLSVPNFFKIKPNDCLYVSDEEEDIEVVKKLGMQTVFIPGESKNYRGADYNYSNIQELLEVLI
jgi:FMN phosphatase YigB (HAD superfamily)